MTARSPEQEAFVAEARAVSILEAMGRAGFAHGALRRNGAEHVGPCPACGGTDRFQVNPAKNVFLCRGTAGGDAIALVEHLAGVDFLGACEILTGRDRPGPAKTIEEKRASAEREREAAVRRDALRRESETKARDAARAENRYRDGEIGRCRRAFNDSHRYTAGGASACYLAARGLPAWGPDAAFLRDAPALGFFHRVEGPARLVHTGPAMMAPFMRLRDEHWDLVGLHQTWLDPEGPKGRPLLYGLTERGLRAGRPHWRSGDPAPDAADLADGLYEKLPTKKMRGSKKGALIPLAGRLGTARRMVAGEGIETVLAFAGREGFGGETFYAAAGDLGNLCGRATQESRTRHPFLKKRDARGVERAVMVPGEEPDFSAEAMPVPNWIEELVLLGDGDSEAVMTRLAMKRGARRHARAGRTVTVEMAPPGMDFSDVAQAGRAA